MKTIDPYDFIHVGLLIRFLRNTEDNTIEQVVRESDRLVERLREIDFPVSSAGTHSLKEFVGSLRKENDKNRRVTKTEEGELRQIVGVVESMVTAESHTKRLYLISENRFNLDGLLNKPKIMFDSDVFDRLPHMAKLDISSGFQCLAFDQPTGSAFHVLRACEAVLKAYYLAKVKQKRLKLPMWGTMLDALEQRKKSDVKLLERLKYIKDVFRNPTAHPAAIYTLSDTQDLIGVAVDVINRMAAALPKAGSGT